MSDDQLTRNPVDVFNDPNVSAVHIATPNRTHYPLAKRALESGKNVLIEKPMTLHSREAYDLVDLATSHELVLRVGHIFRHNAALQAARRILKLRAVGRVYYARVQWTDNLPPFHDRDIVFDLGPHPIDILNLLIGSWPMQASGVGRAYRNTGEEHEVAYVIAEFQDDILAHIELSWLQPGRRREISIVGSQATLVIDCLNQKLARHSNGDVADLPIRANNTIEAEIDSFIDDVSNRSISPESGLIGAHTVEVLETITESMRDRPLPIVRHHEPNQMAGLAAVLEISRQDICSLSCRLKDSQSDNEVNGNKKLEKYVGILTDAGLLDTVSRTDGMGYEITDKGLRFLREYRELSSPDTDKEPHTSQKLTGHPKFV